MKSRMLSIVAIIALSSSSATAADKPVKIYIFAGQSNMAARYPREFLEKNHPELAKDKKVWHVSRGDIHSRLPMQKCGGFGVDRAMVYAIADATDQEIIVFRSAAGGTTLHFQWRPPSAVRRAGGEVGVLYKNMIRRFHNTVANLKDVYPAYRGQGYEVAAFVWFQGENDACTRIGRDKDGQWLLACNTYEENLRDLITDVRRDVGVPDLPVLITQINVSNPWEKKTTIIDGEGNEKETTTGQIIRDIQKRVAESKPGCEWIPTKGLSTGYHYDAKAYVTIGERMGKKMLPYARKIRRTDPAAVRKAGETFRKREYPDLKPDTRTLRKGLVCYFPFDEGKGMSVGDLSGNNLKGALVTAKKDGTTYTPEWVAGVRGRALRFKGNAHVSVPAYRDPVNGENRIESFSLSYWVNKTVHMGYGALVARHDRKEVGWWIDERHNSNKMTVNFVTPDGFYTERPKGSSSLGDGYEWHHFAMVFDGPGKRLDLYFDGNRLPRVPKAITVDGKRKVVDKRPVGWQIIPAGDNEPLRMGQMPYYGNDPFHAQSLDEIAIWNRALSDEEIKTLYNNGNGVRMPVHDDRN